MSFAEFFLVDVFTREPFTGNPLALVADADRLTDTAMRRLAREFNQSETTFVLKPTRPAADWRLRFFTTTGDEVYGAGHNALGAWWWLADSGRLTIPADLDRSAPSGVRFAQEIGDRVLPVDIIFDRGELHSVGMTQAAPVFGRVHRDGALLSSALRIREDDLAVDRLEPQVVSTGAAHLMVPVRDRAAVARARPDVDRLVALVRGLDGQGCYVFALDPIDRTATAHARFFNPAVGIAEDPATGSAAGPLACYLVSRGAVEADATVVVEQGHLVGRPSRIETRVRGDQVQVFGSAVVVARGRIGVG
jgi:trans-2,3-dihydro-3-hydroxyanthranilate isomerase